ncbi:MAG: ferritin-like domain-containing protein [Pyrodictiaceae archaeon]
MGLEETCSEASWKEKDYAERLSRLASSISHEALRILLESVAMDSRKHSLLYDAAAKIAAGRTHMLSPEELRELKREVRRHIEEEAKMIELADKLRTSIEDPRLKLIFETIYEDEVRHHKLLVAIEEAIAEKETISEDEFWRSVWEESRRESKHYTIGPRARKA